ncbi:MAG: hypothetical protein A3I02_04640 [Betaproteobacteria bacterium RIFCSPLOWO2_02_FULL_67_26]|nr:MAG: hypothetical protein A3I02_04640 [Betaproteobacteria bacterium RIFCSPLOWO2_02_FULL_67_26]
MTRDQHLAKALRIVASLRKIPPDANPICVIDGAVIAGYHLGNLLLHGAAVLPDDQHANTPSKLPVPPSRLPTAIQPAFAAFTGLEKLRQEYVRSPAACNASHAKRAWQLLEDMMRAVS